MITTPTEPADRARHRSDSRPVSWRDRIPGKRRRPLVVGGAVLTATALAVVGLGRPATAFAPHGPLGRIDQITVAANRSVLIRGWAFDPDAPRRPTAVAVYLDGHFWRRVVTSGIRPDVAKVYRGAGRTTGFVAGIIPLTRNDHTVCVFAINQKVGGNSTLGCRTLHLGPVRAVAASAVVNTRIAAYSRTMVGRVGYRNGGTSPGTGFDCSGLTSWVYRANGKAIARTADQQFRQFKRITKAQARPGDLIFFHSGGYTFHVGVYQGGNAMVAAATPGEGIKYQSYTWWSDVTFGTITH